MMVLHWVDGGSTVKPAIFEGYGGPEGVYIEARLQVETTFVIEESDNPKVLLIGMPTLGAHALGRLLAAQPLARRRRLR